MGECSALEGGPPCFGPGFTCPALLGDMDSEPSGIRVRGSHPLRPAFPCRAASLKVCDSARGFEAPGRHAPQPPRGSALELIARAGLGLSPVSLAATPGVSVDFLSSGYLDVSVPPVAAPGPMYSVPGQVGTTPPGFPHSGIRGSKAVCASPRLIAACHALRRLPMPRHPPCALGIFSQRPADLVGPRIRRNSSR